MQSHYEQIGGEATVRALSKAFYQHMNDEADFAGIRRMHGDDLAHIEQVLFEFLSGWLGGPQLYVEKYGHPRLRQRHLPFSIGVAERDQWLQCMDKALVEVGIAELLRADLQQAFFKTADFMRNRQEGAPVSKPFADLT